MSTEDRPDYQWEDTVNAIKDAVTGGKLKYDELRLVVIGHHGYEYF
jgi:hypothetical protein